MIVLQFRSHGSLAISLPVLPVSFVSYLTFRFNLLSWSFGDDMKHETRKYENMTDENMRVAILIDIYLTLIWTIVSQCHKEQEFLHL